MRITSRRVCSVPIAVFLAALAVAPALHAQTTWNGTTDALWDNGANWSTSAKPGAGDAAIFPTPIPGTGATITLGAGELADTLNFQDAYSLTAGDLTLSTGTITVSPAITATIGSQLLGTANLTKLGTGILALTGANAYTGKTVINAGALSISSDDNLGTAPGAAVVDQLQFGGGTLAATASVSLAANRGVTLNTGGGTIDAGVLANIVTVNGVIAGAAGNNLTKAGAGTLVLNRANTYAGDTILNAGILRATTSASALGAGALTLAGGELQLANDSALGFGRNTTVTGDAKITSDTLTNVAGVVHTLGTLSIGAQTLSIAAGPNVGSGTAGISTGTLTLTGNATINTGAGASLLFSGILQTGKTLTIGGAGDTTYTGATETSNAGALIKNDSGTYTILSDPNITGGYTVNGGVLILNHAGSTDSGIVINNGGTLRVLQADKLQDAGDVTVNTGGTYDLRGSDAIARLMGGGTVTNGAASGTATLRVNTNTTHSFSGVIQNGATAAIAFTKDGSSTMTLSGASTYTGTTQVNNGALEVFGANASIVGSTTINVGEGNGGTETLRVGQVVDVVAGTLNRLADTANLTLNGTSTGGFVYNGPATGSGGNVETIGTITASAGRNTFTLVPGTGNEVQLTTGSLVRANSGVLLVRGTNLGGTGVGTTRLFATNSTSTLVGGGGLDGATNRSIIPFVIGDTSVTNFGTDFVTHDPSNGIRLLTSGEYASAIDGDDSLRNVSVTSSQNATTDVRINALRITGAGTTATIDAGKTVTINSGAILFVDAPAGANSQTLGGGTGTINFGANEGIVTLATTGATTATLNPARIIGVAGLALGRSSAATTGVIELGGDNSLLGNLTVNQGTVRLINSTALNNEYPMTVLLRPNTALDINGNDVTVRNLQSASGAGVFRNGSNTTAATLTSYLTANQSLNSITANGGTAALNLVVSGGFTLSSDQDASATGTFEQRFGVTQLTGSGGTLNDFTSYTVNGGTIRLTNALNSANANRLGSVPLTLNSGTLDFDNNATAASFSETVGAGTVGTGVIIGIGGSTITVDKAASGQTSVLTLGALGRNTGGTLNITSQNSGTAIFDLGQTTQSRLVISNSVPNVSGILGGWATIDASTTTRDFVKYVSSGTISARGLAAGDYTTTLATGSNPTQNVKITATPAALTGNTQINSLNLQQASASTVALGANTLRVESGGIIISGAFDSAITSTAGGALTAGVGADTPGELFIHALNGGISNSSITFNNAADTLTKSGVVNGSPIVFSGTAPGGLVTNTTYYAVNSTGTTFQVSSTVGGAVVPITADGTTAAFTETTLASISATIADNSPGATTLVKTGIGLVDLSGATNTYTGSTYVNGGTLRINSDANLGTPTAGRTLALSGGTVEVTSSFTLNANRSIVVGAGSATFSIGAGTTPSNGKTLTYTGAITSLGEGNLSFLGNGGASAITGPPAIPALTGAADPGKVAFNLSAPLVLGGSLRVDAGTFTTGAGTNVIGRSFAIGSGGVATFTQASGSLKIGAGINDTFDIGVSNADTIANKTGTLNLTGLSGMTVNVDQVRIGVSAAGTNGTTSRGFLNLAPNNTFVAGTSFVISDSANTGLNAANQDSAVTLGVGANTIITPLLTIGGRKGQGVMTLPAGGTLDLGGFAPNTLDLYIARNNIATGTVNTGLFNVANGTLTASIDDLTIATRTSGSNNNGGATGTFTLGTGAHSISVNRVVIGQIDGAAAGQSTAIAQGTLNQAGGTFTVNNDVVLTDHVGAEGTARATLTLTGGTFTVGGNITKTADLRSSALVTVDGGTLDLTGGNAALSQLTFRSGAINNGFAISLDGVGVTSGSVVTTLTDALTIRDVDLSANVSLTNATVDRGGIRYEIGGPGTGGTLSAAVDLGSVNRTINVDNGAATADLTISGAVNGAVGVGLTKSGLGRLVLGSTSNAYTGPTNVSAGTLEISGKLSASTALSVNNSTLLLSGNDAVNATTNNLSLGATGILAQSGSSKSDLFGALTASAGSTIDFGTGDTNQVTFASLDLANFGGLKVTGWTGSLYTSDQTDAGGGTQDRLLFNGSTGLSPAQLAGIFFFNDSGLQIGTGAAQIPYTGGSASFELVPVPEPSSALLLASAGLLGLAGFRKRTRAPRGS